MSPHRLDPEDAERRVVGKERQTFDVALSGQHPVERIAM